MPKMETLSRQLGRDRQRQRVPYAIPATLADIEIPNDLSISKAGERFLLHDSGAEDAGPGFLKQIIFNCGVKMPS